MNVNILYQTALNLDWKHDKGYAEQHNARKRKTRKPKMQIEKKKTKNNTTRVPKS